MKTSSPRAPGVPPLSFYTRRTTWLLTRCTVKFCATVLSPSSCISARSTCFLFVSARDIDLVEGTSYGNSRSNRCFSVDRARRSGQANLRKKIGLEDNETARTRGLESTERWTFNRLPIYRTTERVRVVFCSRLTIQIGIWPKDRRAGAARFYNRANEQCGVPVIVNLNALTSPAARNSLRFSMQISPNNSMKRRGTKNADFSEPVELHKLNRLIYRRIMINLSQSPARLINSVF